MKRINLLLPALLVITVFASCHKGTTVVPNKSKDLVLTADQLQQASADNTFSFNLFRSVAAQNTSRSNLFMSPLSVSIALGMTTNGANGATLDSMRKTLHFNGFTQAQVNSYYNALITQLPVLDSYTTLKLANSIWYRQSFSVLPQFLQTENSSYLAKVQALDFNDPSSVNTINNWVSNETAGKIPSVIANIKPADMMYLINAIYFKSIWASKFDPANTTSMPFTLANNSQVQTNFMRNTANYNTYADNDADVVEMPYSNNKYSMVIVMPVVGKSVNDVLAGLDSAKWKGWMAGLSSTKVELDIPKFQFTYSTRLKQNLSNMGMGIAFTPGADFTNISAGGNLDISDVFHKAYVAVDENGTTAAAATVVTVVATDILNNQVIINRPFIFAIREMKSGLVVFTGIMNDPTKSSQ
ncbi:MAG: serpin family protein [Sphingobacteriales bacterium]